MNNKVMNVIATMLFLAAILGVALPVQAASGNDKTSVAEVKQETRELLQTLKSYTSEQRDEAIEKTRSALEHLDKSIETLEKRIDKDWDKMDRTARKNARASLRELRRQRTQVAEWYGGLKSSSIEAWEQMKKGFSDALNSLHQAWEKSEKEYGSGK